MKKRSFVVMIIMVLCLSGCGNSSVNSSKDGSEGTSVSETTDSSCETDESYGMNNESGTNTEEDTESGFVNSEIFDYDEDLLSLDRLVISPKDRMNLFYSDDEVYSITIERLYVPESAPNPVGLFYGLTIDRETGRVIYLKDYIPSLEALIQMVETGEYEVEYGGYHVMSQKEIVEHLRRVRTEEEWDTYYLNYYIDKEHIYIIAEDTWGDYSILKLKR